MSGTEAGKVALITGGAMGLGLEVGRQLAARGWQIAVADINAEAGAVACETLRGAGVRAEFFAVDLTTAEGPRAMVAWAAQTFGRLDLLVNNAGIMIVQRFGEMTADNWERTLLLNVRAVALAMSAAGELMKAQPQRGRILNITSPASRVGHAMQTSYAASKAAVDSLTRSGSAAYAADGIPVNSVAPGMMDTAMHRKLEEDMARVEGIPDLQGYHDERTGRIPMGRRTSVEEVARAVVWLADEAPDYITAERLHVAGGFDRT